MHAAALDSKKKVDMCLTSLGVAGDQSVSDESSSFSLTVSLSA